MSARRREPERLEEFVFESTTMVLAAGLEMTKHSVTSAPGEFVREKGPLGIGSTWRCQVFEELVGRINAKEMGALALGRIPYEKWLKFVWKLMLLFLLLTGLLLVLAAALS